VGIIVAGCTGGSATLKGTPLLDDFQTACVATGVGPSKVEVAIKAMGATLIRQASTDTSPIGRMSVESWRHNSGRVETQIDVSFLAARAAGGQPAVTMTRCGVHATSNDKPTVAALLKWLGPDIAKQGDCAFPGCAYREVNGRRILVSTGADYVSAQDAGDLMQLVHDGDVNYTGLALSRSRTEPSAPKAF
jgi:hypothetical protein